MPFIGSALLSIFSLIAFLKIRHNFINKDENLFSYLELKSSALVYAGIVGYIFLLGKTGFFIATFIFLIFLLPPQD